MEHRIKICFTDREWYRTELGIIVGDMGYSFEDARETRRPMSKYSELLKDAIEWQNDTNSDWEKRTSYNENFAIYELVCVDLIYDDEDEDAPNDDTDLSSYELDLTTATIKDIVVFAKESELTDTEKENIANDFKRHGYDVTIHYQNEVD